ncbi:MAG TPA: DNA polymerase III subunit gamma/tau [Thermoanaerobaculia bacterium]|nr:DNA polymerase III subunit gamma/tau [Thermoanaerobaculia bacterium]
MHVALPRKWRPRTFDDLVGQEAAARTLSNAISEGRTASAYLLTGPRGVGKTSTARILARALNCEKGPTVRPCGECASCREILARGDSLDVHEIDGASNRKIENARELIETVRYAPQRDRFRIAIIDEVHMLTAEAFNALLKTLEEPPPHARFILASTELHKIPATIVSRCQRFSFRALTVAEIAEQLGKVAKQEKIKVTAGALSMLAAAAEGSLRDALSLLDQAATLSGGAVDEAGCAQILALVDRDLLEGIFSAAASGDRGAAVATLTKLLDAGEDPRRIFKELLSLLRRLLMLAAGARADLPEADQKRLSALSRAMPYENLLRAVSLGIEADALAKRAEDAGVVLQMFVLKLAELPRLRRIEESLSGIPSAPAAAPEPPVSSAGSGEPRGPRILSLVSVEAEPGAAPGAPAPPDAITRFYDLLDSRRRVTWAHAKLAESLRVEGDDLVLRFGIDKAAAKEALEEPNVRKLLAEVAREAFGRSLRIVLKTGPPADGDLGQAAREVPRESLSRERASNRAEGDPVVRSAMELFRAELTEVKEEE